MSLSFRQRALGLLAAAPLILPLAARAADLPEAATPVAVALPADVTQADAGLVRLTGAARATGSRTSAFAVDPNGGRSDTAAASSRITVLGEFDTGRRLGDWSIQAALAADALTGTFAGQPTLEGDKLPGGRWDPLLLTQAWVGLNLRDLALLKVGLRQSHWGMGLLANDGNHALDSRRDDWFILPTTGDRMLGGQLVLQPFGRTQSAARGLLLVLSADAVIEDSNARYADSDMANQKVVALRWHLAHERWIGVYYARRDQNFHNAAFDGPFLKANVIDAAFDMDYRKAGNGLRVQGEAAVILGRTNLAPTPDHPEHDVRQSAVVAKGRYDLASSGLRFELDGGWFSGDDNLDDPALTGFKANPNFQQGILLFSQVLGWQSGRARITAQNPQMSGYPSADLDRLPTGGAVTSAITAFPKVGWRATSFLEIYGGALLAWSPTPLVDPFSTRVTGGGAARNTLGQVPNGALLGTELDLGAVVKLTPAAWPVLASLRAEYGLLMPGGVLNGLSADAPIHGGRLTLALAPSAPQEHR